MFDENYKSCGDADFVLRQILLNKKFYYSKKYFSTFTVRKNNLSQSGLSKNERKGLVRKYSKLPYKLIQLSLFFKNIEKFLNGSFNQKFPLEYWIYTHDSVDRRKKIIVNTGSYKTNWSDLG